MVDVSKVLRFLQARKFDLMREVPGLIDAQLAKDGSAKVVLRVAAPLVVAPICKFEDEEIPVEVTVDFPDAKPIDKAVVMAGPLDPVAVGPNAQQAPGQVGTVATPNEKAVGPHEAGGRDKAAFEAWKQRNRHMKVV